MATPHPLRRTLAAAALAATLPLTACSQDEPLDDDSTEVVGGAAAPDEVVTEDIKIAALQLAFPEDGQWEEGEDVPLYAALTNTGTFGDTLVDVRGEDFGEALLVDLGGTEGSIAVTENDNVYLEPEGPPSVLLLDLGTSLRSSQSIEVTFVFEEAGEVTMDAPVAPSSPADGTFTSPEDPTD